jgi:3-oxoadipate CoA-transferase, alpha subunit
VSRTVICETPADAVSGICDGATVLVGGFGMAGMPTTLIDALIEQGATDLTIVSNNAGNGDTGLAALLAAARVRKVICSFPRQSDSYVFDGLYRAGKVALEVVPQGNLAERMRAAGAGIGAFSARPASAPCSPKVRSCGPSMAAITCWSTRFAAMSR